MKKNILNPILFLLLVLTTLASCKKDNDPDPSKSDILSEKTWTGSELRFQNQNITQEFMDDTGFDFTKNTLKFEKNGTYVDSYEGSNDPGIWEFAENETKILFDKGANDEELVSLDKLDASELHFTLSNGLQFRFRR